MIVRAATRVHRVPGMDGGSAGVPVWLFDLDDTLHDATRASTPHINAAMTAYVQRELRLAHGEADALRQRYWRRYGATLLGLARHHGVKPAHFLHDTHRLPGLEARVSGNRHDFAAIAGLPGRKWILTNAPRAYAQRVLQALRIEHLFDGLIAIEDMTMFGQLRPKPDARMLRALCARLRVPPVRCVLVEDTLSHHKAARRVGLRTVWLLRYLRQPGRGRWPKAGKPPYVGRRLHSLGALRALRQRWGLGCGAGETRLQ